MIENYISKINLAVEIILVFGRAKDNLYKRRA